MELTPRQRQFIQNLPPGCTFYQEDSLTGFSRTVRVDIPFQRSQYILHVEYDSDPDGESFRQRMADVRSLYGSVAQEYEEIEIPY